MPIADLKYSLVQRLRRSVPRSSVAAEAYAGVMMGQASIIRGLRGRNAALQSLLRAWRVSNRDRPLGSWAIRTAERMITGATRDGNDLMPMLQNHILQEYAASKEAERIRRKWGAFPGHHRVRLRLPLDENPERQGDLIVLKSSDQSTGEKGVLLIKYSEAIAAFPAVYAIERLAEEYMLVLEPSSWGYADLCFLLYIGAGAHVFVESPMLSDERFIAELGSNMVPLPIGAGDWVDETTFVPPTGVEVSWDIAMIASWSRVKRHEVLFKALSTLRERGHTLAVALVGYPGDLTIEDIRDMARREEVLEQCTFFERIPHDQVNEVLSRSRVSVLLSRQEGASKAMYESLFADTPVLVPAGHLGVNLRHVTEETGALFTDEDLPDVLLRFTRGTADPGPRAWALAHTGAQRTSERLNGWLKQSALAAGEPWTRDIVPKKNAPNLRYTAPGVREQFAAEYERLARFLR